MMKFLPIERMWRRVEVARQDGDTPLFLSLLYLGEMVTKLVVAGLVAAIRDDTDRNRYRQLHRLVRATGIGEWATVLDDILTGPSSQHLVEGARIEQKELTKRCGKGEWQYQACDLIHR
ncbi:MAG: NB-ARC domain-containing protein, partial [Planctomycetota bacterium]